METKTHRVFIYAESTPNPATMKFVADKMLLENGETKNYTSPEDAKESPLATQLFNFPFVNGVFIAGNFISVTKNNHAEWMDITLDLREFIKEYISTGKEIISRQSVPADRQTDNVQIPATAFQQPASEIEKRIIEILDEYVRPAVEQDGGAIHFKSYSNGVLKVVLRGSCSGCPSSSYTLKAGIQGLFARMLPEVKEVMAED